jgi:hypothetical protein
MTVRNLWNTTTPFTRTVIVSMYFFVGICSYQVTNVVKDMITFTAYESANGDYAVNQCLMTERNCAEAISYLEAK